ncbi:HAMP domain-containing sensor histidine kinase [Pseudobutyrivibrio xylanivorans]|nr:HAMP domain-containing sensor histidine kinase [Pseudobutyrivibrio xylanivorans]
MRKIKNFFTQSLYIELAIGVLISFLIGFICYLGLMVLSAQIAYSKWTESDYKNYKISIYTDKLQTYIYENQISSDDTSAFTNWYEKNYSYFFYIKKDDYIIYNSFYAPDDNDEVSPISLSDSEFQETLREYQDFFPEKTKVAIRLVDGDATLYLYTNVQYDMYVQLQNLSVAISALITILLLITFVRKKIHYIKDVTSGIKILEGGNLDYHIPVRGNDELSQVADSLNAMRISLSQQMQNEKKALQANNSLVTALSHDLRTPLTTQLGYLEILKEHHYSSPEEMDKYIETALSTCYQIKEMSDRLFEYFLAFDPHPERPAEALEEYDGVELFMQMIAELSLPLEAQGFSFEIEDPMDTFKIHVNMNDMLRVFNNVFTNIDKYADETEPVKIRIFHDDKNAVLSISNRIRSVARKNESAKIGLISISSLMKRQGGASKTRTSQNQFTIELKFPIYSSTLPPRLGRKPSSERGTS